MLLYPDKIGHNNSNNPLLESDQIKGSWQVVADESAKDATPVNKRQVGMAVTWAVVGSWKTFRFEGADTSDSEWEEISNWQEIVSNDDQIVALEIPDEDTGVIIIGTIADDVLELTGKLVAGTARSKFSIVVTHDDTTPTFDFQMTPYRSQFQGLFTGIQFDVSDNIELSYDVGTLGTSLILEGILKKH